MVSYDDLCTAIVQKHIRLLGADEALKAPRKVGVTVDDTGKTTNTTKQSLQSIVDEYNRLTGRVSMPFIRSIVTKLTSGESIDLPDNVK